MKRELSGVVACLQEIEIAAARLAEPSLKPVTVLIREFFRTADVVKAREVMELLSDFTADPAMAAAASREIEVDGIRTNLQRLTVELEEVLEDLE